MASALEKYIKTELKRGVSEDDLKKVLADEGWDLPMVDKLLMKAKDTIETPDIDTSVTQKGSTVTPEDASLDQSTDAQPIITTSDFVVQKPKRSNKWLIIGGVVALLLLVSGVAGYALYERASITPEQIMANTIDAMQNVNSLTFDIQTDSELAIAGTFETDLYLEDLSSYELTLSGAVDVLDPSSPKFSITVDLDTKDMYFGNAELIRDGDNYYAKIHDLGILKMLGLSYLESGWIKLDESVFDLNQSEYDLGNTSQLSELSARKTINMVLNSRIITITEKLPDEQIDGYDTYHVRYSVDKDVLKKLIIDINPPAGGTNNEGSRLNKDQLDTVYMIIDEMNFQDGEIWIDKKDFYLRKITFGMSIVSSESPSYKVNSEVKLGSFNESNLVQIPSSYKSLQEIREEFLESIPLDELIEEEGDDITEDDFGSNYFGPLPQGF